jgi:hypothetical protein
MEDEDDEMEIKIKEFRVRYIGTDPFDEVTLKNCLLDNEFEEGGYLEVDDVKPTISICETCDGIGNLDEGAGFTLNCVQCNGTGYIEESE